MNVTAWLLIILAAFGIGFAGGVRITNDHRDAQDAKRLIAQRAAEDLIREQERANNDRLEKEHRDATERLLAALSRAHRVRLPAAVPIVPGPTGSSDAACEGGLSRKDRDDVEERLTKLRKASIVAAAEADECARALTWWQENRGRSHGASVAAP